MADRPIIFSAPMVRALLDGRKTQTRRVLKQQPPNRPGWKVADLDEDGVMWMSGDGTHCACRLPYAPADRLWVREACATWGRGPGPEPVEFPVAYAADDFEWEDIKHDAKSSKGDGWKIRPSIHMPRWASRLTLIVTDVRVQRLHDISEDDARAEGARPDRGGGGMSGIYGRLGLDPDAYARGFCAIWNSIYGPDAWKANPWVCALTFTVHHQNIDRLKNGAAT